MRCNTTNESILISASEDQTIFIYNILQSTNGVTLLPIGFVRINAVAECINCYDPAEDDVNNKLNFLSFFPQMMIELMLIFFRFEISTAYLRCCRYNANASENTFFQ